MNRLNEDLKAALQEPTTKASEPSHASGEETQPSVLPSRPKSPAARGKRSLGLLIGLLAMGSAILAIALTGIDNAAVYSKGVDELLNERSRFESRNVRVVGTLVRGSLLRRDEPCEYRFRVKKATAELEVHYPQCIIPDTFRDVPGVDVEVTAEGRLQKDGFFLAHQILAKCPSKYDMKNRVQSGEQIPHAMQPPLPNAGETRNNSANVVR